MKNTALGNSVFVLHILIRIKASMKRSKKQPCAMVSQQGQNLYQVAIIFTIHCVKNESFSLIKSEKEIEK